MEEESQEQVPGSELREYIKNNIPNCSKKQQPVNFVAYSQPVPITYTEIREFIKDANPVIPFNTTKEPATHPLSGTIRFQRFYEFFHSLFKRYKLPRYTSGLPFDEYMPAHNIKTPLKEFKNNFDYKMCNAINSLLTSNYIREAESTYNISGVGFMIFKYILPIVLNITDNGMPFLTDEHTIDFINLFLTFEGRVGGNKTPIKISNNNNTPYRLAQDWDVDRFMAYTINLSYYEYFIAAERWNYRYQIGDEENQLIPTESGIDAPIHIANVNISITSNPLNEYIGTLEGGIIEIYTSLYIQTNSGAFPPRNASMLLKGSLAFRYNIIYILFLSNAVTNVHPQLMYLFNQDYIMAGAASTDPKRNFWGQTALYLPHIASLPLSIFRATAIAFYYYVNKIAEKEPEFLYVPVPEKLRRITNGEITVTPELKMYMLWATDNKVALKAEQIKKNLQLFLPSAQTPKTSIRTLFSASTPFTPSKQTQPVNIPDSPILMRMFLPALGVNRTHRRNNRRVEPRGLGAAAALAAAGVPSNPGTVHEAAGTGLSMQSRLPAAGTGLGSAGFNSNLHLGNVREPESAIASASNTASVVTASVPAPQEKGFFAKLFGRGRRTRRRGLKKHRTTRRKVQKK